MQSNPVQPYIFPMRFDALRVVKFSHILPAQLRQTIQPNMGELSQKTSPHFSAPSSTYRCHTGVSPHFLNSFPWRKRGQTIDCGEGLLLHPFAQGGSRSFLGANLHPLGNPAYRHRRFPAHSRRQGQLVRVVFGPFGQFRDKNVFPPAPGINDRVDCTRIFHSHHARHGPTLPKSALTVKPQDL